MPHFTTFSVLFFTRRLNRNKKELSIYARITVNGKCAEMSLKRKTSVNEWDSSKGRLKGTSPRIKILNSYLDQVYSKLLDTQKSILDKDNLLTADKVKASYLGLDEEHKTLKDIITYHNEKMKDVLKWGTLKNYHTTSKYLQEFLKKKKKTSDVYLKQINYQFITEFEMFLRNYRAKKERKTCGTNGTMKHLERLKKLLNLAIKLEWLEKNPFRSYDFKFEKNDRQFLTDWELHKLEETEFTTPSLERVKDMFLFSCYSGLSYIDLKELTTDQLVKGMDGKDWIYTKREKTQQSVKIPLLYTANNILKKYLQENLSKDSQVIFPVISNQKMNKYLKDIMRSIGVRKKITFHSARHTFATVVTLSNGVPIETVSKILGHSKLSTTQIYARVLEDKLSSDISNLDQVIINKRQKKMN
ncbi:MULTISPECIES: site-specific integrase [Flavobacteriaceae]|jgi:site-specific recombinase XerD|uniref:Site-specific integrase n=1 Tax=Christiangramia antarctica TaxID=2058158 RepID=A0ABW5X1J1_9FLAO|nr:site-specific integrase [Gramella sp. AN32]MCM4156750.1 integrase [Gramella sp. AN32]|tara:strand:- start:11777 stop:13021 length:1245 start_codon:yes stop_codon:yes gene_type:complete